MDTPSIPIGISSCLLEKVRQRWAGPPRRDLVAVLQENGLEPVPVCPLREIGVDPVQERVSLTGTVNGYRVVSHGTPDMDLSGALQTRGRRTGQGLTGLCGFLFRSRGHCCGFDAFPVGKGTAETGDRFPGFFARGLLREQPLLPAAGDRELEDPERRASFLDRVRAFERWQRLVVAGGRRVEDLQAFHRLQALTLMSHNPGEYVTLTLLAGRLEAGEIPAEVLEEYPGRLFRALRQPVAGPGMAAVLRARWEDFLVGMGNGEREEFARELWAYLKGRLPAGVPRQRIRRWVAEKCPFDLPQWLAVHAMPGGTTLQ